MTDMDCEHLRQLDAEVALGILPAEDRAAALAHLEHCPACRADVASLSDVADQLVTLTPAAEPPAGFETKVLSSLRPAPALTGRRLRLRAPLWIAAALLLAVAVGAAGFALGRSGRSSGGSSQVATAALVQRGQDVGEVIATEGSHPWVYMSIDTASSTTRLTCEVRESDGSVVTLGSFSLENGSGYWGAPLPAGKTPSGALLVDAAGNTVATAAFR